MSRQFLSKVVIVTGSSSGIGETTAKHFASLGASVVVCGRNKKKLKRASEACRDSSPQQTEPLVVSCDLATESGCQRLLDETIKRFGKLDVLVNNAGISRIHRIDQPGILEALDAVYGTNIRPVVQLSHLAVPHLVVTKGNIVNVSSCAGLRPYVGGLAYCSSKSALDMIAKVMALELGPKGVRVNNVNPAITKTPIFSEQGRSQEEVDEIYGVVNKSYPLGRPGESLDVAKAIAFLASEDASFISGLTMWLDGGSLDCSTGHAPSGFLELMNK